ncbi:GTPase IMAP family member 9-like [Garra rufa]|uniref:GTPase IMAP family member 9-like n=1 Tax=Garra rufa TaxID=137080 RepID=UPI003CCE6AF3
MVLLGKSGSGKSSAGNTILGREYFYEAVSPGSITKSCERGEAQIDDRVISVIDTPGLFDTRMSEEQMKSEIERCVYMSVPGPHAFLLVIRLGVRFTDEEKNTVQWIKDNFGEEAVQYTIILFTYADYLSGTPLDEYISESEELQTLVDECNNRYHLFNNEDMENHSQVTELMEKIENMVGINGKQHYTNEMYKQAQKKIKWDGIKQTITYYGKTILMVGGGAVGATATIAGAAAGKGIAVAGGGSAAVARGVVAAAAKGAVASVGRATAGGAAAAAGEAAVAAAKAKLGL